MTALPTDGAHDAGGGERSRTDGVVVIDKPAGWTSHDVVARCRRIYGQRRVGHSGTLDPGATGVLLVGLGRATRLLRFLTDLSKRYTAELVLGVGTSTLDDSGEVVARADAGGVTAEQVRAAAAALTGPILQVPPMVSAVRVGGKRLHALARQGIEVERAPRPVTVHAFAVTPTSDPAVWEMAVTCSSGTYVRVLAADVGGAVGVPAHLRRLRRVAVGSLSEERARPLEAIEANPAAAVLTPADALADYPALVVEGETEQAVVHGRPLPAADPDGGGPWRVLDPRGSLLAIYERAPAGGLVPAVVLSA
jgi:tRNA pseudouridine55 synthase